MKHEDAIAELGYKIVYEDIHRIHYERHDDLLECEHTVCIYQRAGSNQFLLASYAENRTQTYIPLGRYELELFLKKLQTKETEYLELHNLI